MNRRVPDEPHAEQCPERRWQWVCLALVALVVYGSLYPFELLDHPHAWQTLLKVPAHVSRGDILSNIALFAPVGATGALALRRWRVGGLLLVLAGGCALALALQVAQLWFVQRTAALYDATWNGVGLAAGLMAAPLLRGRLTAPLYRWLPPHALIALLVVAAWLGSELLPWVPSLDWQHVKDNLRPLGTGTPGIDVLSVIDAGLRTAVAGEALTVLAGGTAGVLLLLPLCGLLLVGKAVVIGQSVTTSVVVGVATGVVLTLAGRLLAAPTRRLLLVLLLMAAIAGLALLPLDLYAPRLAADWVPFAGLLRGDMLLNTQALAGRLVLYGGLLWLLRMEGARLVPATVALALWVAFLELLQVVLPGQRADITEPLWVLLCAWVLSVLPTSVRDPAVPTAPESPIACTPPSPARPPGVWAAVLRAAALAAGMTALVMAVLRLPALPYNVRELFRLNGAALPVFVFSLAALWAGASAAWIGHALAAGRRPWLFFPAAVLVATLVSLGLLYGSVTGESILDICGSNNLYHFVTRRDIWGPVFRELFLLVGPTLVAILERPVRYAALVGPLWFFLAFAIAVSRGLHRRAALMVVLAAAPWVWLCKGIAFDGSSTDNLNELIARQGLWGTGGGGYLYTLLALVCASAALLAHRWRTRWLAPCAWLLVLAGVPLGWWLLTHGLEPSVHKYDRVFSGWQFLLGPDRDRQLSDTVLYWRFAAVQLGLVGTLAAGAWATAPLFPRPPKTVLPGSASEDRPNEWAPSP